MSLAVRCVAADVTPGPEEPEDPEEPETPPEEPEEPEAPETPVCATASYCCATTSVAGSLDPLQSLILFASGIAFDLDTVVGLGCTTSADGTCESGAGFCCEDGTIGKYPIILPLCLSSYSASVADAGLAVGCVAVDATTGPEEPEEPEVPPEEPEIPPEEPEEPPEEPEEPPEEPEIPPEEPETPPEEPELPPEEPETPTPGSCSTASYCCDTSTLASSLGLPDFLTLLFGGVAFDGDTVIGLGCSTTPDGACVTGSGFCCTDGTIGEC